MRAQTLVAFLKIRLFSGARRLGARAALRRSAPLLCGALVCGGLAACSTPTGFLEPVPAAPPGATQVEMVVATTRMQASSRAVMFGGARGPQPAFADIVVSIPPAENRKIGDVQWPKQLPGDPARDFVTLKADIVTKDQAIAAFSRILHKSNKKEALIFVHGFNQRFDDAVFRLAQIVNDSGANGVVAPVLFTWPSKGSIFAYGYDRESANYSRDSLEALIRFIAKDKQVERISILAHSMGNWVTLEALRQMAIRDGRVSPKVKLVMLAAPDVDVDIAREQLAAMGPDHPHIVIMVSEDDRALAASREVWGAPRLGAVNLDAEPYHSIFGAEKNLSVINLTRFPSHDEFNHGKFAQDPRVVEMIGTSLASGQTLTDSRVGIGERIMQTTASAASSVGHAAGVVVSAPVAVIDPETREHFGDQVDQLTQSVTSIGPRSREAE
ncbi:alpha/beta hydrolase [Methylocella sp.]|uniref:alpha/beta hydrolase n=1 Tax=Methylocella sp. TaxID=1978226 RepID=UPI0037837E7B